MNETLIEVSCEIEDNREPVSDTVQGGDELGCDLLLPSDYLSISDSAKVIFTRISKTHEMFLRGGAVVEPVEVDGETMLRHVDAATFASRIERYGKVFVHRAGRHGGGWVLKPTTCSEQAAKLLLHTTAKELLPPVALVCRSPVIVDRNGTPQVLAKGWHPDAGGTLVTRGGVVPLPPLADAVELLHEFLTDFSFAGNGDRARALAVPITIALRMGGLLRCAPMFAYEADASQTGKGYFTKLIAAMFGEELLLVTQRKGGVGSLDESLSQQILAGRPFVVLDNVRGHLDSTFLESVLTADRLVPVRVPHRAEVMVDVQRHTFMATSNGILATPDLANRLAIVRIRKQPSGYQFKQWPEGDLLDHVTERRGDFLAAVHAVVSAWIVAGKPATTECRHSFRSWAKPVDWICRHLLKVGGLMEGHEAAVSHTANPDKAWLRSLALHIASAGMSGKELSASELGGLAKEAGCLPPGANADWAGVEKTVGTIMARQFGLEPTGGVDADVAVINRRQRKVAMKCGKSTMGWFYVFGPVGDGPRNQGNQAP